MTEDQHPMDNGLEQYDAESEHAWMRHVLDIGRAADIVIERAMAEILSRIGFVLAIAGIALMLSASLGIVLLISGFALAAISVKAS